MIFATHKIDVHPPLYHPFADVGARRYYPGACRVT